MGRKAKWTKENVPNEFLRLLDEGLTYMDLRRKHSYLLETIQRMYGGVIQLCDEEGIDCARVVSKGAITKYRAEQATKDSLDEALRELHKNEYINALDIEANIDTAWIITASKRLYKSYAKALEANGICGYGHSAYFTSEQIDEIKNLYSEGWGRAKIGEKYHLHEHAIERLLKKEGIELRKNEYVVTEYISKQDSLSFVLDIINKGKSENITHGNVFEGHRIEWLSVRKHFKSFQKAVEYTGEFVLDSRIPKRWSKRFLLEQIRIGYEKGYNLDYTSAFENYGTAMTRAQQYYGNWETAVDESGVGYVNVRTLGYEYTNYGHTFEAILGEYLNDVGVDYDKYAHERWRPDFVQGSRWMDAKLSIQTVWNKNRDGMTTIDKYEPHCSELTIVFLRGNKQTDKHIGEKTRLVSVYKYIQEIGNDVVNSVYKQRFDDLYKEIQEYEDAI